VTFIYTWCPDICPMLTDKMARVQDALGKGFGSKVELTPLPLESDAKPQIFPRFLASKAPCNGRYGMGIGHGTETDRKCGIGATGTAAIGVC